MKLIIAEKPSVARDIASVVGANMTKDGYLTGNNYYVSYAFGHLVGLSEPSEYGFSEKWIKEELPIIPSAFKLSSNNDTKKQLKIINDLAKQCDELIVATDAGREGELIFRWIYEYLQLKLPFKRLWISDMTEQSIKNGMNNLLLGSEKDNLYYAAKARAETDWLVGINSTRLMSLNNNKLISIGRVQTPVLRIIVDRYESNINFTSSDYWKINITIDNNTISQKLTLVNDTVYESENKVIEILEELKKVKVCTINRIDSIEAEAPPKLFSLTSLQKFANMKLNYTADQTLKILQNLYEKYKLVTYPRTDSEHLTQNQVSDVVKILETHYDILDCSKVIFKDVINNSAFNNLKVTDHHAIIPTNIVPNESILSALSTNERNLYMIILVRFFQRFSEDCIKSKINLSTVIINEIFKCTHTQEKISGWKMLNVYSHQDKSEEQNNPESINFPINIVDQSEKNILDHDIVKNKTKPPMLYNEATLLTAMETAGKVIKEEHLKDLLKGKGLGTPATRSGIIELLLKRNYIIRNGKNLIPTNLGTELISKIKDNKISIPDWTAEQEFELYKIETGEQDYKTFIKNAQEITKNIIQDLESVKVNIESNKKDLGKCLKCKEGQIIEGKSGYGCSRYKDGCDFVIWKTIAKKTISEKNLKELLDYQITNEIKGFTSQKGKFNARLELTKDFKIIFNFQKKK